MTRLNATVTGRVQGVGFRDFVRREAIRRNLTGFARNAADRVTVEVLAEGEGPILQELVELLRVGPRLAVVARVEATFGAATGTFAGFTIED